MLLFLIAVRRNAKKWTFLLRENLKVCLLIVLRKNAKKWTSF